MTKKQITLNLTGYEMHGTSLINLWGGGQGTMQMDIVKFPPNKKPTRAMLAKEVNDGQFGCESIESAEAVLYAVYGGCFKEEVDYYEFEKKEIAMNGGRKGV
jgi:hypothetical protein